MLKVNDRGTSTKLTINTKEDFDKEDFDNVVSVSL